MRDQIFLTDNPTVSGTNRRKRVSAGALPKRQTTMLPRSLRSASRPLLRNIAHKKPSTLLSQHRNFTRTGAWRASEDADVFTTRYRNTALFKKLADKPTALAALNDFAQVLKDEGSLPVHQLRAGVLRC